MNDIMDFSNQIAKEFSVTTNVASNVIRLLSEGCTVPFIARYRKEMTNTMNEEVVAAIQKRLEQLDELEKRKEKCYIFYPTRLRIFLTSWQRFLKR